MNGRAKRRVNGSTDALEIGELVYRNQAMDVYQYEVHTQFLLNNETVATPPGRRTFLLVGRSRSSDCILALYLFEERAVRPRSSTEAPLEEAIHCRFERAKQGELLAVNARRKTLELLRRVARTSL
jgi:hypothetical protein